MPGRPTCLTVVGRKTFSSKVKAIDNELAVKSEQSLKEKKKKGKGKEDKRTVSTSGIMISFAKLLRASAELRITLKLTSSNAKPFKSPKFFCFQYSHTISFKFYPSRKITNFVLVPSVFQHS